MKKILSVLLIVALLGCLLGGCKTEDIPSDIGTTSGSDDTAFGDTLEDLNAYEGYFEGESTDVAVACISGTEGCCRLDGNVLTFSGLKEDSVYSISGKLKGNIVIDIEDGYKLDLELQGFSLVSDNTNPITIVSGDEVSITAKKDYKNYIYDMRAAIDEADEALHSGAVYSAVDLEICGKGALTLVSTNNNGIHAKDDLQVKNVSLLVACVDNALKGNDSVEILSGDLTLIATQGDGIKTKNSNISSKGNQKGSVSILGGTTQIYAACDGVDAAYDVTIDSDTAVVNIYTNKYSNYSQINGNSENNQDPGQPTPPDMGERPDMGEMPDIGDMPEMPGESQPSLVTERKGGFGGMGGGPGGMGGGPGGMGGGQGGFGGMDGNTDKSEISAKGIKADNQITVNAGTLTIKSYDDCIHANGGTTLENGDTSLGNVTINGGALTLYSNDDGIHADSIATVNGGTVCVTYSYEGLEGKVVSITGGNISVFATDDGINGTATADRAIEISGGDIYVYCNGDGLDSNSRASYNGILISGGNTVVITNSGADSAIDTEQGYAYTGGSVLAIMPSRGMTNEVTHCKDFSSVASKATLNLSSGSYLSVTVDGNPAATVKIPESISAMVVYLGSNIAKFETGNASSATLDSNGVWWNK